MNLVVCEVKKFDDRRFKLFVLQRLSNFKGNVMITQGRYWFCFFIRRCIYC